jgi:hypothetical protein
MLGALQVLSLHDAPIRHGGSSGALYDHSAFEALKEVVPFPYGDPAESRMRTLIGNLAWMKRRHYAFVGRLDFLQEAGDARDEQERTHAPLAVESVWGNHRSALAPSIAGYLDVLKRSP